MHSEPDPPIPSQDGIQFLLQPFRLPPTNIHRDFRVLDRRDRSLRASPRVILSSASH